jgi:magnesium-transporting ATPase (P-type)
VTYKVFDQGERLSAWEVVIVIVIVITIIIIIIIIIIITWILLEYTSSTSLARLSCFSFPVSMARLSRSAAWLRSCGQWEPY